MPVAKFYQKPDFGKNLLYPADRNAHLFCQLITRHGGKGKPPVCATSLTQTQAEVVKQLGFGVKLVPAPAKEA